MKVPRLITSVVLILASASAWALGPPPLVQFHAILQDEGGNSLPSGSTRLQFQVTDDQNNVLYVESQEIEVSTGLANALIGNGVDAKGNPTGGLPEDLFATGAPRYLQVQAGDHAPEGPFTIVPVPYSYWSQTCQSVVSGAVKTDSISKAAVGFDHLAPDVVDQLATALGKKGMVSTQDFATYQQSLTGTSGAQQVGVDAQFINSGAKTVQGVLQDVDLGVKKRLEETTFLTSKLNEEITNRSNAVKTVSDKLAQEILDRAGEDGKLSATLKDINNIPGTLSGSKIQPNSPLSGILNMNGNRITNLGAPTDNADAATKQYVDSKVVPPPPPDPSVSDAKSFAKAWVSFKVVGGTVSILGSYNVNKVELAPGGVKSSLYTITWGDSLSNYAFAPTVSIESANSVDIPLIQYGNKTATSVEIYARRFTPSSSSFSGLTDGIFDAVAFGD